MNYAETTNYRNGRLPQQALTKEELDKLLMAAKLEDTRDFCIIDLMFECFLRVSEVLALRCADLTVDGRIICARLKGSKSNALPIRNHEVLTILRDECRAKNRGDLLFGKYSRRTLDWRIKRYGNIAGLDPLKMHAHALKHTACQLTMDESDGNVMLVKQLAGHSDIGSTLAYTDLTTDEALRIRERYEKQKAFGAVAGGSSYEPPR